MLRPESLAYGARCQLQGSSRRAVLHGAVAASLMGFTVGPSRALSASPRQRVILDNDFSGDPDGLFQLAHHLTSSSVEVALVVGSHIHVNDFLDKSATQADNAVALVREVYSRMNLTRVPMTVAGRNFAPPKAAKPVMTASSRQIINEAMRTDTKLPLFYCAGAGLTEIAEAVKLEPAIGKRLKLVWIGGMEHPDLLPNVPKRTDNEYNTTINTHAVQTVFNETDIEIWQVPRNVYRQLNISHAEIIAGLKPAGRLGAFLIEQLERVTKTVRANLGETYILGDNPLVTLTALQSSFEPDSSSSAYQVRPTPVISNTGRYEPNPGGRPMRVYTAIDTRLTFADMFVKFAAVGK